MIGTLAPQGLTQSENTIGRKTHKLLVRKKTRFEKSVLTKKELWRPAVASEWL
jgi:hypothetical protein